MSTFRALKHRNYRLFFFGQGVSWIGTWIQHVAAQWLVYRLTHSSWALGMVGFLGQLPIFLLAPLAGVAVDHVNRRKMVFATQSLLMLQSFLLFALSASGHIQVWHVAALAFFMGTVNAVDIPARQAFLVDIVEKKDLGNAIALNSTLVNFARLAGPSIAGLLIPLAGEPACFLINTSTFLAALLALVLMKISRAAPHETKLDLVKSLREGFDYVFHFYPARMILILVAVTSFFGMPYMVLMPVFAKEILGGGAHTLGFLVSAAGTGALLGVILLASRKGHSHLNRMIPIAVLIFGAGLLGFSVSHVLWMNLLFAAMAGAGLMMQLAACNTVLQIVVEDRKRGRVMSLYTTALMGVVPFGNLSAGFMAAHFGAPGTLMISSVCCILGGVWFFRNQARFRREFEKRHFPAPAPPEAVILPSTGA